jgi:hypothetical protein
MTNPDAPNPSTGGYVHPSDGHTYAGCDECEHTGFEERPYGRWDNPSFGLFPCETCHPIDGCPLCMQYEEDERACDAAEAAEYSGETEP